MEEKHIRFSELLEVHLRNTIQKKFMHEPINPVLLRSMRDTIQESIADVFAKSNHTLDERSINWLAHRYFAAVKINSDQSVGDMVVINEYKLSELPYHDIMLMRNLFDSTILATELNEEYAARSQS